MVKIVSWNVNGLRAIIAKGMMDDIAREKPDVVCLQEIKTAGLGPAAASPGPTSHPQRQTAHSRPSLPVLSAPRIGRATRARPSSQDDGRSVLDAGESAAGCRTRKGGCSPSSSRRCTSSACTSPTASAACRGWVFACAGTGSSGVRAGALADAKPVVFCGDMNVAHQEIDIARPEANRMNPGFTDRERRSFSRLLRAIGQRLAGGHAPGSGFIDTFRFLHPDETDRYTWWSYATRARERNIGWRIDYVCISSELQPEAARRLHPRCDPGIGPLPRRCRAGREL